MAKLSKKQHKGRGNVKRYMENKRQTLRNLGFNFRFNNKSMKDIPNDKVNVLHSNNDNSLIIVNWDEVTFCDSYIVVNHDGYKYKIEDFQARKIYNSIKLLYERRLEPIKVRLTYHGAYLEDTILFNEVVKFLRIHTTFKDVHHLDFNTLCGLSKKLSNLFIPYSKSEYFEFLCDLQISSLPVIPVAEKCLSRPDSFLFTYRSDNDKVFIIWESVQSGLATYIFEVKPELYPESLSRIYDYVSSELTTKRIYLRNNISNDYLAENGKPIEHTTISEWKTRLNEIFHLS